MKSIVYFFVFLFLSVSLMAQDYGLDFSGSSQYVNCGLVVVTGANPRTIEAWVFTRTFDTGGVWQFGNTGLNLEEYSLRTHNSVDDRWVVQLWGEDFDVSISGSKNAWTHFALVYDGTNVKLYANGILKADKTRSLNTVSNTFYIGKWGSNYFDGQIDEVRVWNVARTQEQIQATMNVELSGSESDLLAYYRMNEGSGTTITDNSTNSYTGSFVGSPSWVDGAFQPAGSGTLGEPYQIANLNNLYWLSQTTTKLNKYYIQNADIDASLTSLWSDGGWICIGGSNAFEGSYNGNNYTIDGLTINRPAADHAQGFIHVTDGATIENLNLTNMDITGNNYVGGLAGQIGSSSIISNCSFSGSVTGTDYIGGLAGSYSSATVSNCFSTCTVSGEDYVGGLGGRIDWGSLNNCYSTGSVSGTNTVGGMVGLNYFATMNNNYSSGSVSGTSCVGGLVGYNDYATMNNSYSVGSVSGTSNLGGLVGGGSSSNPVTDNGFWDTQTSGQSTSCGGIGKTTAEMKDYCTYMSAGWDFMVETTNGTNNYWGFNSSENSGYPFLAWQGLTHIAPPAITTQAVTNISTTTATINGNILDLGTTSTTQYGGCWNTTGSPTIEDSKTEEGSASSTGAFTSNMTGLIPNTTYYLKAYATNSVGTSYGEQVSFVTLTFLGNGTQAVPYLISTLVDLRNLSENSSYWNSHFAQTADINASETSSWNSDAGFSPIGSLSPTFNGSYNGNDHIIDGLTINRSTNYQGLFGRTWGITIQNLNLTNMDITGNNYVGGLVGNNSSSTITNCSSNGSVIGSNEVGGLVGQNDSNSNINKSYCSGNVTGSSEIGGLVGKNSSATVEYSYSYSSTTMNGNNWNIGGLVGYNYKSTINNCHSGGSVNGAFAVGGLVGNNSSTATVTKCYSTGNVVGTDSFIGGLVGYNIGSVSNCFWDTETSKQSTSGGGTGKTTGEMKTQTTFTDAYWNFTTIWEMIGYNYPRLIDNPDPTLPVILSTFTAQCLNNTPTLYWVTQSETDNIGWYIYRNNEEDYESAEKITNGLIAGYGTTTEMHSYLYEDNELITHSGDVYWYWLQNIDFGGQINNYEPQKLIIPNIEPEQYQPEISIQYGLHQNNPNPFNPKKNTS